MDDLKPKLRALRMLWILMWINPVIILFLIRNTRLDDATAEYVMQIIGIAVTVAAIPICYKFFDSKFARKAIEETGERSQTLYMIHMNTLFFPIILNSVFYIMTGSQSSLFCIGILLLFSLTIWPTEKDFDKIEK